MSTLESPSWEEELLNPRIENTYVCTSCGFIYDPKFGDPSRGIAPGTLFEDLPEDWTCPVCYVGKDSFDPL
jgi:rubredoxin